MKLKLCKKTSKKTGNPYFYIELNYSGLWRKMVFITEEEFLKFKEDNKATKSFIIYE